MKVYLLILLSIFTFGANAQANYVSTYLVNPNYNAFQLHALPWDETRFYQYTRNNGPGYEVYTIDEVAFNALTPVIVPQCSEIRDVPEVLDDGVLIVGTTSSGKELLYYNEVTSTVFDLNVGSGDSDPKIQRVEDRVFVIAFDGTNRQLFEFDQVTHTVSQVTNGVLPVQSVCAIWGDDIYFRTKDENNSSGLDEYNLTKASFNGSSYTFDVTLSLEVPTTPNRMIDWRSPQLFQGNLYFMIVNVGLNGSTSNSFCIGMITVDVFNQVSTSSLILPNIAGEFFIVQWDGQLGVYSTLHDSLYTSPDGLTFQSNVVPANGRLVESHISENDQLYFTCLYIDDTREIFEYDNGFQSKFVGEHLHFLSEQEGVAYYTDYVMTDSSSIVLVYTNADVVDEVKVYLAFHPPIVKSSVLHDGLFTFLFGAENGLADENDILQLTGAPSASVGEKTIEASLYPNPVQAGSAIIFETNANGIGVLSTIDGKHIRSEEFQSGTNVIETSSLSSGVYIISFMNHTQRIVVN